MIRGSIEKIPKNYSQTFSHHMPQRVKITVEQEERIVEALTARPHASQVARDTGWSFSTVWRVAQRAGIELTAGRETMGRHRLSPEERARVIETRSKFARRMAKYIATAPANGFTVEEGYAGAGISLFGNRTIYP